MALLRDTYEALEAVLGTENISEEPVILDAYAFQCGEGGSEAKFGGKFVARPEAVLLPASTEEVQAIVKVCNRYKVKFKAFGTGYGFWGSPSYEGVVQLDLRRMNRILEIDEKNMRAVVEPYVSAVQLQVEAQQFGLNCHFIGAGASSSVVATTTSMQGYGSDGIYMGVSARNILGAEWVLPTGEILRIGSRGSGMGWFCGDGPGPSLRGIMRGALGAAGGFGVFTKVATKLYAWPGPPVMPIVGDTPRYNTPLPDNFSCYVVAFPSWKEHGVFWRKIGEAEIGYHSHKLLTNCLRDIGILMSGKVGKDIDQLEEVMNMPETEELLKECLCSSRIVLAGHSPRHTEYQERVLREILAKTGGHIVEFFTAPPYRNGLLLSEIKHSSANEVFNFSGNYGTTFGFLAPADTSEYRIKLGEELKQKHIDEANGKIITVAEDMAASLYEQGQIGAEFEEIVYYDPHDLESCRAAYKYKIAARDLATERGLPVGMGLWGNLGTDEELGKYLSHPIRAPYFHWQRRVKEAFDVNNTSADGYVTLEEKK
jgi:glycolate oxidase